MFQVIEDKERDLRIFLDLAKNPDEHARKIKQTTNVKLLNSTAEHELIWNNYQLNREKIIAEINSLLEKYPIESLIPTYTEIPWAKDCKIYVSFGVMGRASENRVDIGYLRDWKNLPAVLIHELIHFNTAKLGKESMAKELATDIIRDKILERLGLKRIGFFENKKYNALYNQLFDSNLNFKELSDLINQRIEAFGLEHQNPDD